jgi:hypothetical protein
MFVAKLAMDLDFCLELLARTAMQTEESSTHHRLRGDNRVDVLCAFVQWCMRQRSNMICSAEKCVC